jgi:inhibitor of KinA
LRIGPDVTEGSALTKPDFPSLVPLGVDGVLIRFGDTLTEPANRAALAFRAAVDRAGLAGIEESTTALASTYLRLDPMLEDSAPLVAAVQRLLVARDWFAAELPEGRRLWQVPAVFGTDLAPQLAEVATLAGLTPDETVAQICAAPLRVQAIGFAPGQPYLGHLPAPFEIPRQTGLTPQVPPGALAVAIRQMVLFSVTTPTGWRHVGQTAVRLFRPDQPDPFLLRPGDEVLFHPIGAEALARLRADPDGGARLMGAVG